MTASTYLTDTFREYWNDESNTEYLEAIEDAISEIEELGLEAYAKRTLAKLKELRDDCKEDIKKEAEFEGVCPYCGTDLEYNDRSGEYECHECGYNGGYVPNEDRLEDD